LLILKTDNSKTQTEEKQSQTPSDCFFIELKFYLQFSVF